MKYPNQIIFIFLIRIQKQCRTHLWRQLQMGCCIEKNTSNEFITPHNNNFLVEDDLSLINVIKNRSNVK